MAVPTPKQKPVVLSDGTVWEPYPPLVLKPPGLRLSIEDLQGLKPPLCEPKVPASNPGHRALALKVIEDKPDRESALMLLDSKRFGILREIFILYSDRSTELEIRVKAFKWLNQRVSRLFKTTLQSAALREHEELSKIVRDSL